MKMNGIQSLLRPHFFAGIILAMTVVGCDAKLDEFFAPATDIPGGGGSSFPSLVQLDGLPVTVNYNWISSTCDSPPLTDFTADADLSTSGTTLNVTFADAPVPISGTYVVDTGAYSGDTGPVDVGGGLDADESWTTNFTLSGNMIMMTGTSFVDVTSAGSPVCNRQFNVSFTASF